MGDKEAGDQAAANEQKPELEQELDRLQQRVPDAIARVMQKVRHPSAKPYRIPIGIALIGGGVVGFLPILGFWMIPLGLAVMAQDVPPLRPPLIWGLKKVNGRKKDRRKDER